MGGELQIFHRMLVRLGLDPTVSFSYTDSGMVQSGERAFSTRDSLANARTPLDLGDEG